MNQVQDLTTEEHNQRLKGKLKKYFSFARLPKVLFEIVHYWMVKKILNWKNKPAKVLKYPHPKLKQVSEPIDFNETNKKELLKIFKKMFFSLQAQTYGDKLGIAAPQIGINKRMIIVQGVSMINPEWTPTKAPLEGCYEGCYSLNKEDVYKTQRAKYGWVKWQTIKGEWISYKIKGVQALVFQHELGHLQGQCCNELGELVVPPKEKIINKRK